MGSCNSDAEKKKKKKKKKTLWITCKLSTKKKI
jgi:hypothetical protein